MSSPSITRVHADAIRHQVCVVCGSSAQYGHKACCWVPKSKADSPECRADMYDATMLLIGYRYWATVVGEPVEEDDDGDDEEPQPFPAVKSSLEKDPNAKLVQVCTKCRRLRIDDTDPCHCFCGTEKYERITPAEAYEDLLMWLSCPETNSSEDDDDDKSSDSSSDDEDDSDDFFRHIPPVEVMIDQLGAVCEQARNYPKPSFGNDDDDEEDDSDRESA